MSPLALPHALWMPANASAVPPIHKPTSKVCEVHALVCWHRRPPLNTTREKSLCSLTLFGDVFSLIKFAISLSIECTKVASRTQSRASKRCLHFLLAVFLSLKKDTKENVSYYGVILQPKKCDHYFC